MDGTAGVVATCHMKGQVVIQVLEGVVEVVDRGFGHQLLPQFALHVEGIWDAVAHHLDAELHLLALGGLNLVLFDFNLIGEGLFVGLLVVDDTLRRLHGKRREKHNEQDQQEQ